MNTVGKLLLMVAAVFGGGALLVGGCVYSGYNRAITLDQGVKAAWAQVENQLQRRFDLIPNLVSTVKGVAGQEEKIFLGIADSRKAYFAAGSSAEKMHAANGLESALSRLLVLHETYPDLKSNQSFLDLQSQLEGAENRLSVERKKYNETVQALNTLCRKFPGRYYCNLAGVEPAQFFEIEDAARAVPKVDFTGGDRDRD
ncbi:MAG: LemA family protein [Phycisphaerales bacterium]|nr:LemA family protein [Phycisphaerales bacterium]